MSFKFNPFTGNMDLVSSSSESFNIYDVDSSETIEIPSGRENIVTNPQTVTGILIVGGRNTVL